MILEKIESDSLTDTSEHFKVCYLLSIIYYVCILSVYYKSED